MAESEQATTNDQSTTTTTTTEESSHSSVPIVLVTGASGFIATHVLKLLLQSGKFRVRGTVRDSKNEEKTRSLLELVPDAKFQLELVSADLVNEDSWKDVVKDCTYVLHLASPFPARPPKNEELLIRPAVDGTLNVLKACSVSGSTVKRVVMASSIAAVSAGMNGETGKIYTDEDWSDEAKCFPYEKSKLIAEKAGWDYMKNLGDDSNKFEFVTLCPAVVVGPILTQAAGTNSAISMVFQLLANKTPGVPNVSFPIVDVRTVSAAFVAAMQIPECAGNRYLLTNETQHYNDTANMIADEFRPQGYKIPTKPIMKLLFWVFSKIDSMGKLLKAIEGKRMEYNNDKLKSVLGIESIPLKTTIIDCCYSLIDFGVVNKTAQYLGHPDNRPSPNTPQPLEGGTNETEQPKIKESGEPEKTQEPPAEEKTQEPPTEDKKQEQEDTREPPAEEEDTENQGVSTGETT